MIELAIGAVVGAIAYRLRGGGLKTLTSRWPNRWWNGSHACRAVWALTTGPLIYELAGGPLWTLPALVVSVFLSMALIGHGAHMVYDTALFFDLNKPKTEMLTWGWLPRLFGGEPHPAWPPWQVAAYNMVGMSAIGLARNLVAVLPVVAIAPVAVAIYAASGALHGPLYWAGWRIRGGGIQVAELLVGALSWTTLLLVHGDPLVPFNVGLRVVL